MPGLPLAAPRDAEELYLARGDDVPLARPLLPGDVLTNVDLDFDDHDGLVMVVAHPCAMRGRNGILVPRITVAPVRAHDAVRFDKWPDGHYRVLPLLQLHADDDSVGRAVHLLELSAARSERLDRAKRILALTDHGVHILQQRLVHSLTRVVVGLDQLQEQSSHVLLEAELEEEWVGELAGEDGPELEQGSTAFAQFMDEGHRAALLDATRRTDTVRTVRAEIKRRKLAS